MTQKVDFPLVHVNHFKDLVMGEGAFNLQVTGLEMSQVGSE